MLETAIAEVPVEAATADDGVWIEALPARVYHTPMWGEIPVTHDKLQRMIHNFHSDVRGQEIATDYDHGIDPAKGMQASGWYRDFEVRPSTTDPSQMSLFAKVQFTEDAKADIKAGKYKYWSLEWDDEYETDSGHIVPDVVIGGGLTNRPVAKRTMPINFSEKMWDELDDDTQKAFADWSQAYKDSLPDSAFLYVNGKDRRLPYKDKNGKIDMVHLQKAVQLAPQMKGLSESLKSSLQAKARRLLGGMSKAASEDRSVYDAAVMLTEKGYHVISASETAAWEHSDPGIVAPLYASAQGQPDPGTGVNIPRQVGDPAADDPAIGNGWRWEPLPVLPEAEKDDPIVQQESRQSSGDEPDNPGQPATFSEGGKTSMKLSEAGINQLTKLFEFETPADTDEDGVEKAFLDKAANAFSELKTFKDTVGSSQQEKTFAEQFPAVHKEMQELKAARRDSAAIAFSETVKRFSKPNGKDNEGNEQFEPTRNGLSALALETIADTHKKFSEGSATLEDYETTIKTIMNGGIVEFGEVGSSRDRTELLSVDTTTPTGIASARKAFAEVVAAVQAEDPEKFGGSAKYSEAIAEAAKRQPELAEAYRATAA